MFEMFSVTCSHSEHEEIVITGDTCVRKVRVLTVTRILCLLFTLAGVNHLNSFGIGLELCDVEQFALLLLMLLVWHKKAPNARGLVPVC